jgi:hypothetical protein
VRVRVGEPIVRPRTNVASAASSGSSTGIEWPAALFQKASYDISASLRSVTRSVPSLSRPVTSWRFVVMDMDDIAPMSPLMSNSLT